MKNIQKILPIYRNACPRFNKDAQLCIKILRSATVKGNNLTFIKTIQKILFSWGIHCKE